MTSPTGKNARVRVHNAGPKAQAQAPTPSEALLRASPSQVTIDDARGRKITVRKLLPSDKMRLASIIGADRAKNEVYLGYATLAAMVVEIDGDIEPPFNTVRELEVLVDRLGDEGLEAIGEAQVEHFMSAAQLEALKDLLKN